MNMKKDHRRLIEIIIYFIVVVLLVFLVVLISKTPLFSTSIGEKPADGSVENVSMILVSPEWNVTYMHVNTKNVTVAEFLFECADHYNFSVQKKYWQGYKSFLIEAIQGIENGEDNRYWQFYVNGNFADVGCSNYFLNDNDVVMWRFEPNEWR